MAYAESESMALKRLKVALKRKDWQMFEYGITRMIELLKSGSKISEIQEWYKILDSAKTENVPEEQVQKLTGIIESIMSPGANIPIQADTMSPSTETVKYTPSKMTAPISIVSDPDVPFIIFLNSTITEEQAVIVNRLRYNLNKIAVEPDAKIDPRFLSDITCLLKNIEPSYQELNGLDELLKTYPEPGIIITTGYDSEIIRILRKNDVNYSIEGVKKASGNKAWKIFPLAGMTSIYWCPSCKTRSFYTNNVQTAVSVCKKCSEPAYPDLYVLDSDNTQVDPKLWYLAYQALVNSANWLLISPPNASENDPVSRLFLEACNYSMMKNAYIVSNKSEIGTWWRNKLEETNANANVVPVCFNVEILFNNYIKIPGSNTH